MTVTVVDAGPGQVSRSVVVDAPVAEVFGLVADPRRHAEFDGSGTVRGNVSAPERPVAGSRFTTRMTMFKIPYRITSTITALKPNALVEWRHPFGHHWRFEFEPLDDQRTRVTETFDYRDTGPLKDRLRYYERTGFAKRNATGIEQTLERLRQTFA
ncbi:SRPBCC family protein [Mycobacterium sp. MYCO198283]|uniref:SRPBCC family protein n=1 Tax=Mycobacterium sp. MYCO198283 TaxID=2883505 RepID=UPI001E4426E0|nr:SRPBCC family protein [Mycobacterium sp. MYCO198283]MCG5434415.1 SRPBCC family protein [Mycobacterium sp. MYCO198283]